MDVTDEEHDSHLALLIVQWFDPCRLSTSPALIAQLQDDRAVRSHTSGPGGGPTQGESNSVAKENGHLTGRWMVHPRRGETRVQMQLLEGGVAMRCGLAIGAAGPVRCERERSGGCR